MGQEEVSTEVPICSYLIRFRETFLSQSRCTSLLLRSPKITLEQQIQKRFRKVGIIVHMFVEFKMAVNHVLKQIIDNVVECETGIFGWIDTHTRLEGGVVFEPLL